MSRIKKKTAKLKIRSSTRATLMLIAIVLLAVSSSIVYSNLFDRRKTKVEKETYKYSNNYNLDYSVNMKDNKFINELVLPKNQTYISDLINSLNMSLKYNYNSSKDTVIDYNYSIDTIIKASYSQNGENYEIWNKKENIKTVENQKCNQNININENVNIDYEKYHKEVKDFKQTMGMTIDAYLYIELTVNTTTNINGENVNNKYVSDFSITLGDKIAKVDGKTSDSNDYKVSSNIVVEKDVNVPIVILNCILLIGSIYVLYLIKYKTRVSYNIRNEYRLELNRILKSCQDKIVIVKNKVEVEQENTIDVKEFGELIKLSEELYKPILYWSALDQDEAWFCVISNKINYRFILKK